MEYKETDSITKSLCDINLYHADTPKISSPQVSPNQTSSSQNEKSDKESKKKKEDLADEKYFHFKLKYLLNADDNLSFSNVEIEIPSFLKDIESYIEQETQKNKLDEKKAIEIKEEINNAMIGEKKIKLDSCFINVQGKEIIKFFQSLEKYSFPSLEGKILENESYVILVESTHSLRTKIPKKTEQLRKYNLFFSSLDKWLNDYKKYLGTFFDYFIGKYFLRLNSSNTKLTPKTYKANFSLSRKFVILIISDHTLKLFKETISNIEKSQIPLILKKEVKKCFPSLYGSEKKNYQNEVNNNEIKDFKEIEEKGKKNKKSLKESIMENLPYLNYLINQINKENNWTVKIIYLDLYLDLIVPNCVIAENLNLINKEINTLKEKFNGMNVSNKLSDKKEENTILKNEINTLKEKNEDLEKQINEIVSSYDKITEFLRNHFNEKDLPDLLKHSKKQENYLKNP